MRLDALDRRVRTATRARFVVVSMGATLALLLLVGVASFVGRAEPAGDAAGQNTPAATSVVAAPAGGAFVLLEAPSRTQPVAVGRPVDLRGVFSGEEFSEVYVRFEDRDAFGSHFGDIGSTIRIGVGVYDDRLRDVFPGAGTRIDVGGRAFDVIEVERETFVQTALVPVDTSARTFLVIGRGVAVDELVAMAEPIDATVPIPRIGPEPEGFVPLHSGRAEFPALSDGVAVSYAGGDRSLTIATYDGVGISCFAYAWVFPNAEIAPIGGDAGVIAQLSGPPGGVGAYRVLWNQDFDTLVGFTATGFDREELVELASQLVFDSTPDRAHLFDLQFAF